MRTVERDFLRFLRGKEGEVIQEGMSRWFVTKPTAG